MQSQPQIEPQNGTSTRGSGHPTIQAIHEDVQRHSGWVGPLQQEIARVIVGLLTNGHLLIEGVPGLAKTLSLKTLAGAIDARFQRLQFTPDMLPADVVGTLIYNPRDGGF